MSFACAQTMNSVTANCGDCSAARTSSAFLRVLGIAAAVSFLFILVVLSVRLRLVALIISLLGIILILAQKREYERIA